MLVRDTESDTIDAIISVTFHMDHNISFGYWVQRRRKQLDLTQADLASKVNCSLSMLRKIEKEERRPSKQLAELLADHLGIADFRRDAFLKMARGQFIPYVPAPTQTDESLSLPPTEFEKPHQNPGAFVARGRELRLLHDHLDRALEGQGRMVFIGGEAGRGKTSLLYEFAQRAKKVRPDLLIAGGSSDVYTGQGDPLLPFRDIFRLLVGDFENVGMRGMIDRELRARLMRTIPITIEILLDKGPHLIDTLIQGISLEAHFAKTFPDHPKNIELLFRLQDQRARRAPTTPHELQQDRLFDEISITLRALALRHPLLLMLDDLHWVDQSTAALLGHLTMRLKHSPILILGSYRPEDLTPRRSVGGQDVPHRHPLSDVLSESLRQFGQNRIDLDHSDPGEELDFVNALLDAEINTFGTGFRERLAQLTEGQPLFVVELLRDMKERGDIIQGEDGRWKESGTMSWEHFPARVEGVIEKRMDRLRDDLRDLLTVGSVQGETFTAEVIARVKQEDSLDITRRLSANLDRRHRLIQEQGVKHTSTERLSQYRFRHQLFQKYLYGRLTNAERIYLHEAVGHALEAVYESEAGNEEIPAAQLARHFQAAHQGLKASRYLLLAGQNATRIIAHEEAAAYYERALVLLDNEVQKAEIVYLFFDVSIALAGAYWHGGRVAEAIAAFKKSIGIARTIEDPNVFAKAVLAYEEPRWRLNLEAERSQGYMREALARLPDEESSLRVRLLVNLARTLLTAGEREGLSTTVNQALQLARQFNDPVALCDALRISAQIDRRPETISARIQAVQEMTTIAKSIGDQERLADALDLYIYDQLELGNIAEVDKTIAVQKKVAEEIKQPFQLHVAAVFQTMRAIMRGEFGEAERLAHDAAELSQQIGLAELDGIFGIHMFTIRWEQGRLHEIAPIVKQLIANNPSSASWRPGLALIYRTLGHREACQDIFEDLASDEFAFLPHDSLWVATLAYLTEVCAYLEDCERAAILYKLLLPYEGRTVVVGGATACYGAAARYLGMLARTTADLEAAERHFEAALDLDARMEAWPWLAHGQCEYAVMRLVRGRASDREGASGLLDEALTTARRLNMAYLIQKIENLQASYELVSG